MWSSCGIQSILTSERASFGHCHAYRSTLTVNCPPRKASEFSDKGVFHLFSWAKALQRNLYSGYYTWRPITGKKNWEISHFWLGSTGPLRPLVLSPYLSKRLFFRIMLCVVWIYLPIEHQKQKLNTTEVTLRGSNKWIRQRGLLRTIIWLSVSSKSTVWLKLCIYVFYYLRFQPLIHHF